ncbi:odontogenesis associated phosphoprotein [Sorex araneus]|uniref:odontogenesis associated phosphoprotein n=1 Tax=Sorex araneus TaxID=42254 RepID=UPI002433CB6B|nr:odontogenesis associated phosphoprotein [Sorex araneus]
MAHTGAFSCLLLSWLLAAVAEGQDTPPGVDPTDCQIFTLTPPPVTRHPVTRFPPIIRTPKCPIHFFPPQRPRVHVPFPFPNRPFVPPRCNHRVHFQPVWRPQNRLPPRYNYFPIRQLQKGSSSEESREKREAPRKLKQKKRMLQKRLK